MFTSKAVIGFPTHKAVVNVNSQHIHVFKYNSTICDFAVFNLDQQTEAGEYLITALSDRWYRVTFPGEDPNTPY
jgi:hypothetical protein